VSHWENVSHYACRNAAAPAAMLHDNWMLLVSLRLAPATDTSACKCDVFVTGRHLWDMPASLIVCILLGHLQ
jgi:hypothetical protein